MKLFFACDDCFCQRDEEAIKHFSAFVWDEKLVFSASSDSGRFKDCFLAQNFSTQKKILLNLVQQQDTKNYFRAVVALKGLHRSRHRI